MTRLCDLHCDTITECMKQGEGIACAQEHIAQEHIAPGHVSLEQADALRANGLRKWLQVFAIFVPDSLQKSAAAAYFDRALRFYHEEEEAIKAHCTPVLALENANALNGDLRRLEELRAQQVRIVTLTWNGQNELGYGAHCEPLSGTRKGLTPFGKQAVRRMHALGIVPDVSHLNPSGFDDVAELGGIFIASHSNCAAVCPHRRNLSDAQIKAVIAAGGLIGLTLYPEFLGSGGTAEALAQHLRHIISLGGEDHMALGSDFDGCAMRLSGMRDLPALESQLAALGVAPEQLEKFFWHNGANFFKKHLQTEV